MEKNIPDNIMVGLAEKILADKSSYTLEIFIATAVVCAAQEKPFNSEGLPEVAQFVINGPKYGDDGKELASSILKSMRIESNRPQG